MCGLCGPANAFARHLPRDFDTSRQHEQWERQIRANVVTFSLRAGAHKAGSGRIFENLLLSVVDMVGVPWIVSGLIGMVL